jgi:hypothetical protein
VSFASGVLSGVFVATETNSRVYFRTGSVGVTNTYYLDNVSVREIPGYHATAPSDAARPNLRLDGNGKFYLDRDTTDDNLPITWPTVLSESQLGPELIGDSGFNGGGWWTASSGVTINAGVATFDGTNATGYVRRESVTTEGKTYLFTCVIGSRTAGTLRFTLGTSGLTQLPDMTAAGTYSALYTATATSAGRVWLLSTAGPFAGTVDSFSIKEVTGTNVIYTATGDYTTKDSGLILSGATDYKYPQRPSGDYGRIVMAAESKYDAKIIKYLDQKRGRSYLLGPELVTNGDMSSSTGWTLNLGYSIGSGVLTASGVVSSRKAYQSGITTSGKSYLVTYSVSYYTSGNVRAYLGGTNGTTRSAIGTYAEVLVMGSTDTNAGISANTDLSAVIDNVSVREILL